MKLAWKLAIPQICIALCLGLVSYFVISSLFVTMREQYVRDVVENRFARINRDVETSAREAVGQISLFVRLPVVIDAYEIAGRGNIDDPWSPEAQEARELLRREFAPMLDSYSHYSGAKLELHFHLPNGRSLVRLWRDKQTRINGEWVDISDDISSFRPTVMDVNRTGNIAMGIDAGSGGFAIRGVIPVIAPDGRHLGSAEGLKQFEPFLTTAMEEDHIYLGLYANNELLEYSVALQDSPLKDNFVRVVEIQNSAIESLITAELLVKGKTGTFFENFGPITLAASPVADYSGRQVGVMVCAMNTAAISNFVNAAAVILALMLAGTATASTIAFLLRLRLLVTSPLNMIKAKIQDIAEDRADLSGRIPNRQKDEIGELAVWFNTLTAKLDGILSERQAMLSKISDESGKFEAMAHWYASILDSIPFFIIVQDAKMNWTFINTAAERLVRKKREEAVGLPCSSLGLDICDTDNCVIACAKRGRTQTHYIHLGRSYQINAKALFNLQGEPTGYIEIVQDVTESERMAIRQAKAEAASRAKSEFLANMSHEIRTPLNAIIGMAAIGKSSADIERKDYCLTKVDDASKHLLGVINDILDMSKIEAGKFELSPVKFCFETLVQRVVNIINFRVADKKQRFTVHIDNRIPETLIGDDLRLAQVITNLLGNAIKFTPEKGSITLNAKYMGEEDGVSTVQIEVTDTGIGISPEQQEHLFQSFSQAQTDTTRKYGGTGLGLSISKKIVEMMGGRIWIESELDKGSVFAFTFQVTQAAENDGSFKQMDKAQRDISGLFAGRRILLAEDIEINREIVLAMLASTLLEIDCAENGETAFRMFSNNPERYDMVFMDLQMPEVDGFEATRRIREFEARMREENLFLLERPKGIPIIAMTANVFQEDIDKCLNAGMNDHIGKPINFDEVLEKLRHYL